MFANLLRQLMLEKRVTASDLARQVWGTTTDYRGYVVAKGRDRIGHYLAGTSFPEKENLQKIAKALGVPFEKLEKAQPAPPVRQARNPKDLEVVVYQSGPKAGQACLSISKVDVSLKTAMTIMDLIKADQAKSDTKKKKR